MKMICPGCGAVASAESWLNDATCREALAAISKLPAPLPKVTLGYLSLFRPGKQSLTWKKALRLITEIEALTGKGYVHINGRVDRNCNPGIWAQAMEQMVEHRLALSLPMPNHNYLAKVAYDLADSADYQGEKKKHVAAVAHQMPVMREKNCQPDNDLSKDDDLINRDPLEKIRREWDAKHGAPSAEPDFSLLSGVVKGME